MAELNSSWWTAFGGEFETEEDVIVFIFERLNTDDFEDSYIDMGNFGEPNEMVKQTAESKVGLLYDFMMELVERKENK